MKKLVLASSSAYRKALLERLQLPFECDSPNIDESSIHGETGPQQAQRLSRLKARAVAEKFPDAIIIGSDQVAELITCRAADSQHNCLQERIILGKPGSHAQAVNQLIAQSDQRVSFHSGLTVIYQAVEKSAVDTTEVQFRALSDNQIEHYLRKEQPYDCAGSFKAESLGISLFKAVNSNDPTSLVGLPLIALCKLLREFEVDI
jgi:septum formation protein